MRCFRGGLQFPRERLDLHSSQNSPDLGFVARDNGMLFRALALTKALTI